MSTSWTRNATALAGAVTLLLVLMLYWSPPATAQAESDPRQFLDRFGRETTDLLSDLRLSQSEREQGFSALLSRFFDVAWIGHFVLGKHRHRISDQERLEYLPLFEEFLIAVYGRRLSAYPDMDFTVGHARVLEKTVLVDSVILYNEGERISLVWRLRRGADGWRIIDASIEGISMAITQRSEFDSVIQNNNGSIRALLDKIRAKIE